MRLKKNLNRYSRVLNFDKENGYKIGIGLRHCCQLMEKFVDDPRVEVYYGLVRRTYSITTNTGSHQLLFYCPFCGHKLPKNLHMEWFKFLNKEYGLDDPGGREQSSKIPEEFKSDEWWEKRKL